MLGGLPGGCLVIDHDEGHALLERVGPQPPSTSPYPEQPPTAAPRRSSPRLRSRPPSPVRPPEDSRPADLPLPSCGHEQKVQGRVLGDRAHAPQERDRSRIVEGVGEWVRVEHTHHICPLPPQGTSHGIRAVLTEPPCWKERSLQVASAGRHLRLAPCGQGHAGEDTSDS